MSFVVKFINWLALMVMFGFVFFWVLSDSPMGREVYVGVLFALATFEFWNEGIIKEAEP